MEGQYEYPDVPGSKVPSGLEWIDFAVDDALCDDDGPRDNSDQNIRWAIMRHLSDGNNLFYASDYGAWNTWIDDTRLDGPYKGELHQYRRLIDSFSTFDLLTAGNFATKWIHICEGESMKAHYTQEVTSNAAGEIIESRATHQPGQESSVEIKQDAKGEPKITVKVYHADPNEAAGKAVALYHSVLAALQVREENPSCLSG